MKAKLKLWGVRLLPLISMVAAFVTAQQHVAMSQPGAYAVGPDINGLPLSEIVGGLVTVITAVGATYAQIKGAAPVVSEAQATEEGHLSALNSLYFTASDWDAADLLKQLRVHRAGKTPDAKPAPPLPSPPKV